ncbi:MAG: hypothetical protein P8Y97_20145 [Candidatus Lokiarchaeota archaeon]
MEKIIEILKQFKRNPNKRLNLGKVCRLINVDQDIANSLLNVVLNFQDLLSTTLKGYKLVPIRINGISYIELQPFDDIKDESERRCNIIIISRSELDLLSDTTFIYRHINNGEGFNLHFSNGLEEMIINLSKLHPYFFKRQNSHIIPSSLGLELGDRVLQFKKIHKQFSEIEIGNYLIKVSEDGSKS